REAELLGLRLSELHDGRLEFGKTPRRLHLGLLQQLLVIEKRARVDLERNCVDLASLPRELHGGHQAVDPDPRSSIVAVQGLQEIRFNVGSRVWIVERDDVWWIAA